MHLAATEGHIEIVKLLLKKGCTVNILAGPVCGLAVPLGYVSSNFV